MQKLFLRSLLLLLSMPILAATACGGLDSRDGAGQAEPPLERGVVVDRPVEGQDRGSDAAASEEAGGAPGERPGDPAAGPRSPSPVPMDNEGFATEQAGTAIARQPAPSPIGQVLELPPVDCGAISLSSADAGPDCTAEVLRAGTLEGREFAALLVFDLGDLPSGAGAGRPGGIEILYAALELSGLDDAFAGVDGSWRIQAVELPAEWRPASLSFARLMALPGAERSLVWRLRAEDFPPGQSAGLDLEGPALAALQARLGKGLLAFRIEGIRQPGGAGDGGLLGWHAAGEQAPRLRLAYFEQPSAP